MTAAATTVFFPCFAISDAGAIRTQETRLARVAARHMKVGALWYGDRNDVIDPTLVRPIELLDNGFPFLKRSLVGKHRSFIDEAIVRDRLKAFGHPV